MSSYIRILRHNIDSGLFGERGLIVQLARFTDAPGTVTGHNQQGRKNQKASVIKPFLKRHPLCRAIKMTAQ